ncbi:DUF4376 domain-containing protein [Afifella sp. H1R]|uniref:DUF4376 domain-containing protein n=1 Tax=Afifella sp. H1R TaxID=2908841 RepID=UPI001F414136|nr:DUF4376 domain-containing protein [Afifella sp. H1R]MCF1502901.1 DUF4376 domain-containing protein [Afifella sp. H1R]
MDRMELALVSASGDVLDVIRLTLGQAVECCGWVEGETATAPNGKGNRWMLVVREDAPVDPDSEVATEETVTVEEDRVVKARGKRALTKDELKVEAARLRWETEEGGMIFNEIELRTDTASQGKYTAAALAATLDEDYTVRWKCGDGCFVTLDAPTIIAMAQTVRGHVQACFDAEAGVVAGIEDGSITSLAQIRAAYEAT